MAKIGPLRPAASARRADAPVKKALLIGINYTDGPPHPEFPPLCHAHEDTKELAELLIAQYDYERENVVMLLDEEGCDPRYAPTRYNILREIRRLVHGARSGDYFMFYYSGHSGQVECQVPNSEEEDGMDEYVVPADHWRFPEGAETRKRMVLDNKLRQLLVDPLPAGANLTAIFDSCHSGTLLDLDHYRCNDVYFPWVSPGFRRNKTLWRHVRRKNDREVQGGLRVVTQTLTLSDRNDGRRSTQSPQAPTSRKGSTTGFRVYPRNRASQDEIFMCNSVDFAHSPDGIPRQFPVHKQTMPCSRRGSSLLSQVLEGDRSKLSRDEDSDVFICSSPIELRTCNGFCDKSHSQTVDGPNVISLSACGDSQMTWESKRHSFTQALMQLLRLEPHQPVAQLVRTLTFQMYEHSRKLHRWSQNRREAWKQNKGTTVGQSDTDLSDEPETPLELVNFSEPQIGSLRSLPPDEMFNP
ncbi:caspase domain-containing protein [Trametes elegans]|nr:caspase domain-containing protein [Trametes elegans]